MWVGVRTLEVSPSENGSIYRKGESPSDEADMTG